MIDEEQDISEVELDRIIDEKKRHKELISAISKAFKNDDKDLSSEVRKNNDLIVSLLEKISNLKLDQKELPTPQVNVTTDNRKVIEEITSLNETAKGLVKNQEKIIELLSSKPSKLEVIRNSVSGTITHIEIKYKNI